MIFQIIFVAVAVFIIGFTFIMRRETEELLENGMSSMTEEDIGLINKYFVQRTDGKVKEGAQYFVLDMANDPGAVPAIVAYIGWCEAHGYPELAADLENMLEDLEKI